MATNSSRNEHPLEEAFAKYQTQRADLGFDPIEIGDLFGVWGDVPDDDLSVSDYINPRTGSVAPRQRLSDDDWLALLSAHEWACLYCGQVVALEVDHIIPVRVGGSDALDNLAPACRRCNASKGAKLPLTWISSHREFSLTDIAARWERAGRGRFGAFLK